MVKSITISMSFPDAASINSKDCVYGCNTKIYWNTLNKEYVEVTSKKKHICPNRSKNNNKLEVTASNYNKTLSSKPTHYNNNQINNQVNSNSNSQNYKKSWFPKPNYKQPMDNSLEILKGPIDVIRKQYEVLSDLIKEFKGKTHGSQSNILSDNSLQIIVYYEVPEGTRDEIKRMFEIYARNDIRIQ
jgi:archaellum component FlaC